MNIKLCYFQKNCIVFPTKLESQIESLLHTLGAIAVPDKIMYAYYRFPYTALTDFNLNKYPKFVCDKDNNLYNVLYLRRSKRYRLTNVDNLKKRFKVNKTELETKYYDV